MVVLVPVLAAVACVPPVATVPIGFTPVGAGDVLRDPTPLVGFEPVLVVVGTVVVLSVIF